MQNRYVAALSRLMGYGVEMGRLQVSPLHGQVRSRPEKKKDRFLSRDELARLLSAAKDSAIPDLYDLILMAVSTGTRQTKLVELTWDAIDLERQQIAVTKTKSKKSRAIPVKGEALHVLELRFQEHQEHRQRAGVLDGPWSTAPDLVFRHTPEAWPRKAFATALKRAGIEGATQHTLRHTFASYYLMSGASLGELAELLGHETLDMVRRYAHLAETHTHRLAERMTEAFIPESEDRSG